MRTAVAISAVLLGCASPERPPDPQAPSLDTVLTRACRQARTPAGAQAAVADWQVPAEGWPRLTVPPFRDLHAAYAAIWTRDLDDTARAFATACTKGLVPSRPHYALDAKASLAQNRERWIVPVLFPSRIVDGIDGVFAWDGVAWRNLRGADEAMRAPLRAHDPACWAASAKAGLGGPCSDAAWLAIARALEAKPEDVRRGCAMMLTHCDR